MCYQTRKCTNIQTDPLDATLAILTIIHSHAPTRPLITIIMTVRTHMVNKELKTIHKEANRNL